MATLSVVHKTTYRYARPVVLGEHRLMCRPRDSHDLRLLDTALVIKPAARVRWLHDAFANSIAVASFAGPAAELYFESRFSAEHYPADATAIEIEPYARVYPFHYSFEEMPDLVRTVERHYPDPERRIDQWARGFLGKGRTRDTLELLSAINAGVKDQFEYLRREEMGTQLPTETLQRRAGSCRDFALFMMEAARSLGFAARFVSGYLYDEALIGASSALVGGGATHAWMQVFLPGAGWVEFDPTNALVGGRNLIRVAVARDAAQAAPLSGSFTGTADDFLEMTVEVQVTSVPLGNPVAEPAGVRAPDESPTPAAAPEAAAAESAAADAAAPEERAVSGFPAPDR
jgi:transglutaminase-like putative cysteine protease